MKANDAFTKYYTFPEYDTEEEKLKLEAWLYLIWDGEDPIEYLWGVCHGSD